MRRMLLLAVLVASLVAAVGAFGSGRALAYGIQDGPQAQIEVSFNCMNATYCQPPLVPQMFGLWIWAEVDANNQLDYTLSGCGHQTPNSTPGDVGGGGSPAYGTWESADNFAAAMATTPPGLTPNIPFAVALNPDGSLANVKYYVLHLHDPVLGDFNGIVPQPVGHYNVSGLQLMTGGPVPGITTQTQVAP